MDEQHKKILRLNRSKLVDEINIDDGLLTQLLSREVITKRTADRIKAAPSSPERTEKLLDLLLGPNAFQGLCDSLIAIEQKYVVDMYLMPEKAKKEDKCPNQEEKCSEGTEVPNPNSASVAPSQFQEQQIRDGELAGPSDSLLLAPSKSHAQFQYSALIQGPAANRYSIPTPFLDKRDAFMSGNETENRFHKDQEWERYAERMYHQTKATPDQTVFQYTDRWYSRKGMPDFTEREREEILNSRIRMKHYVTKDSMYNMPNMTPREVGISEYGGQQGHSIDDISRLRPNERNGLSRNDSLDGMTKRPFHPSQENREYPGAKRLRAEDTVILPVRDRSGVPICVRDSSYDHHQPYKMEPEIFMVNPLSKNRASPTQPIGEFDDPDIDLTDGPVSVKVGTCERQFYINHFKKSYAMRRIPRGQALIINVNEVEGKAPRRGTDIDRDNLHNLLNQLHFSVTVYNDCDRLSAEDISMKLQKFASLDEHYQADCCVVCLLSHGEEGYLFGTDGRKLQIDGIFSLFDNTSCKSLIGKPKIFIIQACRGGALDTGVAYSADEIDGSHPSLRQLPSMSDMLICYPTQSGYYAWRNRERGSWYIEALVQVLMKYAKNEDICTMLNRVNQLVSRKISRCPQIEMDQMSQMSEYKSTLRKPHLFFFPGIGSV